MGQGQLKVKVAYRSRSGVPWFHTEGIVQRNDMYMPL